MDLHWQRSKSSRILNPPEKLNSDDNPNKPDLETTENFTESKAVVEIPEVEIRDYFSTMNSSE